MILGRGSSLRTPSSTTRSAAPGSGASAAGQGARIIRYILSLTPSIEVVCSDIALRGALTRIALSQRGLLTESCDLLINYEEQPTHLI